MPVAAPLVPDPVLPVAPAVVRHSLKKKDWVWAVVITALVATLLGGIIGAFVAIGRQRTVVEDFSTNGSVLAKPGDIQQVLARVEPAVVSIDTTGISASSSGSFAGGVVEGAGTGMILTPDGEVLTNDHVVAGATSVTVTLFGQTDPLPAHVLGTDPSLDLALVQIDNQHGLPTVSLGDSAATRVGDSVLAIGNALALAGGPSVTEGIVSATDRSLQAVTDVTKSTETLKGLLQTDAAINPGNSGGPLVDSRARVIGMNTAVATSSTGNAPAQNIGFAIAIDSIKPQLAALGQGGTGGPTSGVTTTTPTTPTTSTAYLGVVAVTVTPSLAVKDKLATTTGALVQALTSGGPAATAGLQTGDVIVSVGGTPVTSATGLAAAVKTHRPGDLVTLVFYRGPDRVTLSATLTAAPTS